MTYLILFYEFFKTGLFSIGGGLATLPFLMRMAENYDFFTKADLLDMIAISESTPGPIGINMATYAGFKAGGILGSAVTTIALVLPAFIIIIAIYKVMERFKQTKIMQSSFYGIRPATSGLIASALYFVVRVSMLEVGGSFGFNIPAIAFFSAMFAAVFALKKLHPIAFIIVGAIAGYFIGF